MIFIHHRLLVLFACNPNTVCPKMLAYYFLTTQRKINWFQ